MYKEIISTIDTLTQKEKQQLRFAYHQMISGNSISPDDIPELYKALPFIMCENDTVVAVFGLDTRPCAHRITLDEHTLYTWCIWDAFFIAEVMGKKAQINTHDPVTDTPIVATYDNGQWDINHHYWVTFPADTGEQESSLRSAFCRFVHLFETEENAHTYGKEHSCEVISVDVLINRGKEMADAIKQY